MGSVDPEKLASLPQLHKALMDTPLVPLLRGFLPHRDALYVLYQNNSPYQVGSPPHLDETALAGSVHAHVAISIGTSAPTAPYDGPETDRIARAIHARWLVIEDEDLRLMLEAFVAKSMGLEGSHPKIVKALYADRFSQTEDYENS